MSKVEILIVDETKIDPSFLTAEFSAEGYHEPYSVDMSESGCIFIQLSLNSDSVQVQILLTTCQRFAMVRMVRLIEINLCFRGKRTCIDLILTNQKCLFKNTDTFKAGLRDHNYIIFTKIYV